MKGVHWIDLGQWPCRLAFVADEKGFARFNQAFCDGTIEPGYPKTDGGCCYKLQNPAGEPLFLLAVGKASSRNQRACTIAHEAVHVMQFVLEHLGEEKPGIETQAYLVEHVLRNALQAVS